MTSCDRTDDDDDKGARVALKSSVKVALTCWAGKRSRYKVQGT